MSQKPFSIEPLKQNSVAQVFELHDAIDVSPVYQRVSDVWGIPKRQLFIDSLLNDFDVPKLYFHELDWKDSRKKYRFAVIDGKQRLEAIWKFMQGEFPLGDDFEFMEDPTAKAANMTYADLARHYPEIKSKLDKAALPIMIVRTNDLEMIEEMFSRLNEAVPLNAPEKRNSLGGPLPDRIRQLARQDFFVEHLPFANGRYRHLDLATKFLYIEYKSGVTDTKKSSLDTFVLEFKEKAWGSKAEALFKDAKAITSRMADAFAENDPLLRTVGMVVVYYLLYRAIDQGQFESKYATRHKLQAFEDERLEVRAAFRASQERALRGEAPKRNEPNWAENEFVEFDRLMQSPNDAKAIRYRLDVLQKFLVGGGARKR